MEAILNMSTRDHQEYFITVANPPNQLVSRASFTMSDAVKRFKAKIPEIEVADMVLAVPSVMTLLRAISPDSLGRRM
jgi:predicted tellurium resistance membrane protein TerC